MTPGRKHGRFSDPPAASGCRAVAVQRAAVTQAIIGHPSGLTAGEVDPHIDVRCGHACWQTYCRWLWLTEALVHVQPDQEVETTSNRACKHRSLHFWQPQWGQRISACLGPAAQGLSQARASWAQT